MAQLAQSQSGGWGFTTSSTPAFFFFFDSFLRSFWASFSFCAANLLANFSEHALHVQAAGCFADKFSRRSSSLLGITES